MPPGGSEPSELDEALFGDIVTTPVPPVPRRAPDHDDDVDLDVVLFGNAEVADEGTAPEEVVLAAAGDRSSPPGRGARILVAVVAVLMVLGLGGAGFAVFGTSDDSSVPPAIEVKGSVVTRAPLPASTIAAPGTTSTVPSTTAAATTDAAAATATTRHVPAAAAAAAPEEEPAPTHPPVVEPPPTSPPPTPTTEPPTTTTTVTPTPETIP